FLTDRPKADECEREHLWSEGVYVALPIGHELTLKDEISWADLCSRRFVVRDAGSGPQIHEYLAEHLAEFGHEANVERCSVGRDNLMQLVAMGQGLTVMSEAATAARFPGVAYRPLEGEILPFYAVWSPRNDNPAFSRLLSLARAMAVQGQSSATS